MAPDAQQLQVNGWNEGFWMREDEVFSFLHHKDSSVLTCRQHLCIFFCSAKQSLRGLGGFSSGVSLRSITAPPGVMRMKRLLPHQAAQSCIKTIHEDLRGSSCWRSGVGVRFEGGWQLKQVRGGGGVWAQSDVILHGENQTCAAAQQLLLAGVQLALQRLLRRAAAPLSVCAPAQLPGGVRSARRAVGRDGSVAEHEGQVGVAVDQVRVWVPQLLVILENKHGEGREGGVSPWR